MNTTVSTTMPAKRKVGFWLGFGIFLLPIVFVWFLLRDGHTKRARIIGFIWFGLFALSVLTHKNEQGATAHDDTAADSPSADSRSLDQPAQTVQGENGEARGEQAADAPLEAKHAPEITISAAQLYSAYSANEIAADRKYKGHRLLVTGTVESVQSDMTDDPVVSLNAGTGTYIEGMYIPGFGSIDAHGINPAMAATLSKGQRVSILCTSNGEVAGDPQLSDCLVQN